MIAVSISLGLLGLSVGLLGILCTYVWKGNHKLEKALLEGQRVLEEGQKEIAQGQKEGFRALAEMLLNQTKILERIEAKIPG